MEGVWLKTKNPLYLSICKFWTKVFALTFGMGVVSGIVMAFQLGTNWAGYAHQIGDVLGPLFTYEVLTAFFVEAGFLGVMLFGWEKVGPKLHYTATLLVFIGVTLSAFWILSANSWMQTPTGYHIVNGKFEVSNWLQVIFNPSLPDRFPHMLLAAYLSTALAIAGISAFYLLKQQHLIFAKKCFSFALWTLTILIPLQVWVGDSSGLEVRQYQPLKTAAMEAIWNTQKGAPFVIIAWPDQTQQKNLFAIEIPYAAAFINTHHWEGELTGLKSVSPNDQPYVPLVFFSFRIMLLAGGIMLLIAALSLWLRYKKQLYEKSWFLKLCMYLSPTGFVAIIAGWFTTETGRQPWIVYNLLRTSDSVSPVLLSNVITSFILIFIVYGIIFGVFYFRYFGRILHHGPANVELKAEDPAFHYLAAQLPEEKK
jgi:cytochrome d ubiquinol oxidase subunit I